MVASSPASATMTSPLSAAAICAYAGRYGDEIRETLAHYDYSTPGVSEIFFAPVAWEALLANEGK